MIIKKVGGKLGFTLIELMIAIVIMVILTMTAYAPYNYYQNKAKLKVTAREISQLLYESRNMAVNWSVSWSWNLSIWVYFDNSELENNKIKVLSYPYDIDNINFTYIESEEAKLIKTLTLKKWIQIDDLDWKNNLLFVFDAISWDIKYYTWTGLTRNTLVEDEIPISFSYKWSSSPNLSKTINYFSKTNIIDY